MIADKDPLNASALRVAQQKTDKRIAYLRKKYGIPEGQLPPEDMLWLNDLTVRELERWSLHNRGKTTYARALAAKRRHDRLPRTLVELGYLRSRYVAYRNNQATPAHVQSDVQQDEYGMFVLVDDLWGTYTDRSGTVHDATTEGYDVIIQQFLYCFDVVNAAIAQLDGVQPPQPVPRWQKNAADKDHRNNGSFPVSRAVNTTTSDAAQRGNFVSAPPDAFVNQDTIDVPVSSMVSTFRTTSWTAETLIGLSSAVLPVPDKATCKPEIWEKEWQRPAELLLVKLQTLSPTLAWERIDLTTCYMVDVSSPSYWQTGRAKQTPTTLRHVANHIVDYYDAYKKGSWHPSETTPYDGPPLDYVAGYQAVIPASAVIEEPPIIVEPPEIPTTRPAWMSRQEAVALCDAICDAYPTLHPALSPDATRSRWCASIEIGPGDDQWYHLTSMDAWRLPEPATVDAINAALLFAVSPPESRASEEPPPIILEPPEFEDPLRGLRPLEGASSVEELVQTEPLPGLAGCGKTGMSLWIAEALLGQIVSAGYTAEQRLLAEDRAYLVVEVSPGAFADIESAAEWQRHLKSSTSPLIGRW